MADIPAAVHLKSSHLKSVNHGLVFLFRTTTTATDNRTGPQTNGARMQLTSAAFKNEGKIPRKYTCEGDDRSPPLEWSGAPQETKSFALIVDDPDAPDPAKPLRVYVHWVLCNIPANTTGLDENGDLPASTVVGVNDFGNVGWGGPCPPTGRHRYFFKLYALDAALSGLASPKKKDLENAMEGHILAQAELMGTYQKGD
jgi:Raf kinase inhibitor-like YbhB/YbcL family protein